jgi:transcriptional regulator with XRE-family HTH domain
MWIIQYCIGIVLGTEAARIIKDRTEGGRMLAKVREIRTLDFPERLATLRKQKGLSQGALAKAADLHINQIKRYEKGTNRPTSGALKNLAQALGVSTDELLFGANGRGPDDELRLQFETICTKFEPDEKQLVRTLLDSLILRHEARRWGT